MESYTQLNNSQSKEVANVSCQEEMDKVLSQYFLQVFKVVNICDEGEQNHRYFLAESVSDLQDLNSSWITRVV